MEGEPNNEPTGLRANLKRKRKSVPKEEEEDAPCRICGKCIDYCLLHDPFSDDEDKDKIINITAVVSDETFSVTINDGEPTLKEVK